MSKVVYFIARPGITEDDLEQDAWIQEQGVYFTIVATVPKNLMSKVLNVGLDMEVFASVDELIKSETLKELLKKRKGGAPDHSAEDNYMYQFQPPGRLALGEVETIITRHGKALK